MPTTHATQNVKQVTLEAKVIRADGSVEELGVISYYHRNPLRRWAWRMKQVMKGLKPGRVSIHS